MIFQTRPPAGGGIFFLLPIGIIVRLFVALIYLEDNPKVNKITIS